MGSGELHIKFDGDQPIIQRLSGKLPKEIGAYLKRLLDAGDDEKQQEAASTDDHDQDVEGISDSVVDEKEDEKKKRTEGDKPSDVLAMSPPFLNQDAGKAGEAEVRSGPQRIIPAAMAGHPGVIQNVSGATSINKYGNLRTAHVKNAGSAEPIMNVLVRDADAQIDSKKPPQAPEMTLDETLTRDEMATLGRIKQEIYEAAKEEDLKKLNRLKDKYLKLKGKIIDALNVEDVEDPDDMAEEAAKEQMVEEQGVESGAEDMEGMTDEEEANSPVSHDKMIEILRAELEKRGVKGIPGMGEAPGGEEGALGGEEEATVKSIMVTSLQSQRLMWDVFDSDEPYWKSLEAFDWDNELRKAEGEGGGEGAGAAPSSARSGGSVKGQRYMPSHVGSMEAKSPHVDVSERHAMGAVRGGPGSPPRGGKYLWRWWDGDHWRYKYSEEAHGMSHASPESEEGIGKTAAQTMVQGYDLQHRGPAEQDEEGNPVGHKFTERENAHKPAYVLEHSLEVHPDLQEHLFDEKGDMKTLSEAKKSAEKAGAEDVLKELKDIETSNQKRGERHNPETGELEPVHPEAIHADDLYRATLKMYEKTHPEKLYWVEHHPDGTHIFKLEPDLKNVKHVHLFEGDAKNPSDEQRFARDIKKQFGVDVKLGDDSPQGKEQTAEFLKYLARTTDNEGKERAFTSEPVYEIDENGKYNPVYGVSSQERRELGDKLKELHQAKGDEKKKILEDIFEDHYRFADDEEQNPESFSDDDVELLNTLGKELSNVKAESEEDREEQEKEILADANEKIGEAFDAQRYTNHPPNDKMSLGEYKNFHIKHAGGTLDNPEEHWQADTRRKAVYFRDDEGNPIMALVHDPTMAEETRYKKTQDPITKKWIKTPVKFKREFKLYPLERNAKYSRIASRPMDFRDARDRREKFKMYSSEDEALKAAAWHILEHRIKKAAKDQGVKPGESFIFQPFKNVAPEELHPVKKEKGGVRWYASKEPGEGERFISAFPPGSILHDFDTGRMRYKVEYAADPNKLTEEQKKSVFTPGWDAYHQRAVTRLVPIMTDEDVANIAFEPRVKSMIEGAYNRLVKYYPLMEGLNQSDVIKDLMPHIWSAFTVTYDPNQPGTTFSGFVPGIYGGHEGEKIFSGGGVLGYLPSAFHHKFRDSGLIYRMIKFDNKKGKYAYKSYLREMAKPANLRAILSTKYKQPELGGLSSEEAAERKAYRGTQAQADFNEYAELYGGKDEADMTPAELAEHDAKLAKLAKELSPEEFRQVLLKRANEAPEEVDFESVHTPEFNFSPNSDIKDVGYRNLKNILDMVIQKHPNISNKDKKMLSLLANMDEVFPDIRLQEKGTGLRNKISGEIQRYSPISLRNRIEPLRRVQDMNDYLPLIQMYLDYPELDRLETKQNHLEDLRTVYDQLFNQAHALAKKYEERRQVQKAIDTPAYREAEQRLSYEVDRLEKAVAAGEISRLDLEKNTAYQNALVSLLSIKKSRMFGHAVEAVSDGNPVKDEALHYMTELVNGNLVKATGKTSDELMEMMVMDIQDATKALTGKSISLDMAKALLNKWYMQLKETDLFKGAVYMTLALEENDMDTLGRLAQDHFHKAMQASR